MADINNTSIMNADGTIIAGDPKFLPLMGEKLRYQIITIHVQDTDPMGKRYPFQDITATTNKRVVGIFMTSTERGDDKDKCVMDSTIELTLDNEEILPPDTDCHLITAKIENAFYDNPYVINERANGSVIKGTYVSSSHIPIPAGGYDVKIYLQCVANK